MSLLWKTVLLGIFRTSVQQRVRCMHVYEGGGGGGGVYTLENASIVFDGAVKCASSCAKLSHS